MVLVVPAAWDQIQPKEIFYATTEQPSNEATQNWRKWHFLMRKNNKNVLSEVDQAIAQYEIGKFQYLKGF